MDSGSVLGGVTTKKEAHKEETQRCTSNEESGGNVPGEKSDERKKSRSRTGTNLKKNFRLSFWVKLRAREKQIHLVKEVTVAKGAEPGRFGTDR